MEDPPRGTIARSGLGGALEAPEGAAHFLLLAIEMVESPGDGDPVQPRREAGIAPIARQGLEGGQEDFLHDVLRVLVMTQDAPDHRPDVLQVPSDELIECRPGSP